MNYPYEQIPGYCWFDSMPYFRQDRSEGSLRGVSSESSKERLAISQVIA